MSLPTSEGMDLANTLWWSLAGKVTDPSVSLWFPSSREFKHFKIDIRLLPKEYDRVDLRAIEGYICD